VRIILHVGHKLMSRWNTGWRITYTAYAHWWDCKYTYQRSGI